MAKNSEIRIPIPVENDHQGEIRVSVIFPKYLIVMAELLAALDGGSRSDIIRTALTEYLTERGMINNNNSD